jgi:pyrroloquinoline quinone biosynthesis protein B
MLRERSSPLPVWCTAPVWQDLTEGNPVLRVLDHYCGTARHGIPIDGSLFDVPGVEGLAFRAMPLASKAAPYSPHRDAPVAGDNIGVTIIDRGRGTQAFYAPGLGEITPPVFDAMCNADVVLVDGTFWRDDEMVRLGISKKLGSEIGHLAQSGPGGMIEWLGRLPHGTRRVLLHINNTNPILDEDSPERAALDAAGIVVGEDGMTIDL